MVALEGVLRLAVGIRPSDSIRKKKSRRKIATGPPVPQKTRFIIGTDDVSWLCSGGDVIGGEDDCGRAGERRWRPHASQRSWKDNVLIRCIAFPV